MNRFSGQLLSFLGGGPSLGSEGEPASQRRLELINCLANTEQHFLKRLYDRTPIFKRYRDGEAALHFHFDGTERVCLRWRRKFFGPLEFLIYPDQATMPVCVGEFADQGEYLPSVVRLKPLEKREMFISDALKVSGTVGREILWAAFNRKLDAMELSLRILLRHDSRGVIERVSHATCALANDDSHLSGKDVARLWRDVVPVLLAERLGFG
jgi:hypothetical protein